jgi:bifunctional non-homologous end joining protein LigD
MSLDRYWDKRDFDRTPEPSGRVETRQGPPIGRRFVVQRHRATRLHYDFRLEIDGVLASWAVPKGPTLDASVKRAAFHVEDHPLDYFDFEGTIPKGEYGGGDVIVWDWGTFEPEATNDPGGALAGGELKMVLRGEKLKGRFTIVRTKSWDRDGGGGSESWLLIKKRDGDAAAGWDPEEHPRSVKTGRTNDEVAAGAPAKEAAEPGASPEPVGRAEPMPAFIEPMTATLADGPFDDPEWLFEVKWDGYRVQAHVRDGRVALFTRRGLDAATYFPELAGPPDWIAAREAIVDGEVVALDENGRPDFGLLQARRAARGRVGEGRSPLAYVVFDLLYIDGRSLVDVPLEERKEVLRSVLRTSAAVQSATHVVEDGVAFYRAVAERGLEGVVAKLRRGRYESGRRSTSWLKIKRRAEQEVVIGGWVPRENSEDDLGALIIGTYEKGQLRPAGKVGTGFDERERRRLMALLGPLARPEPAFRPVPREKGARWVEPALVARVEFVEWTSDGRLRAPSYKGLDDGADARAVRRERPLATEEAVREAESDAPPTGRPRAVDRSRAADRPTADDSAAGGATPTDRATPPDSATATDRATAAELEALELLTGKGGLWSVGGRTLKLSNLDKVLWPADGFTKRDLIRFYVRIAPFLLPYIADRALTLRRYPDGVERTGFWQKRVPGHAPDWVACWPWDHASSGRTDYLLADSVATLAWVANEAAIDIHPSTFRVEAPDRPTWALIDIDPGERTRWEEALLLARLYGTALRHLGVRGFPKLTGQRGIQIWIPIRPNYSFDQTRDWVEALSRAVSAPVSELVSWKWEKSQRDGLARLDYTQNAWNKTLVAPYSVRPSKSAAVSVPLTWEELDDDEMRPDCWNIRDVFERLAEVGDPMAAALSIEQDLPHL